MKKFLSVTVLYRDALVSHNDLIFYKADPQELSAYVRLRGNTLVSAFLSCAGVERLLPADSVRLCGETLTIERKCFQGCADDAYAVLRLVFTHGQDGRIPIYVAGADGPPVSQRLFPMSPEEEAAACYRTRGGLSFSPQTERGALVLPYDFTDARFGRTAVIKLGAPRPLSLPRPRGILVRLKGDGSYHTLSLRLYNGCGASEYPTVELLIDFEDERTLYFPLPSDALLPLSLCDALRLRCTHGGRRRKGELILYEITATSAVADSFGAATAAFSEPPATPDVPPSAVLGRSRYVTAVPSRLIRCITSTPDSTAAFACATDGTACRLEYREAGSRAAFMPAESACEKGRETEGAFQIPVLYHRFFLSSLKPDTCYEYRLNGGVADTFRTFPSEPAAFSAVLLADAQIGSDMPFYERYRQILDDGIARTKEPRLILLLGDMVCEADDAAEFSTLVAAVGDRFVKYPLAPTPGNHERDDGDGFTAYRRRLSPPISPIQEFDGLIYSFDIGAYRFFSVCADGSPLTEKACAHIESMLVSCNQKWKIVFLHCSPYSGKGTVPEYRDLLAPVFEHGGVDIVFSGHSHIYVRASVWEDRAVAPEDGILYLTMGTSGPKAFANDRGFWQDYVFGDRDTERYNSDGTADVTCATAQFSNDRVQINVQTLSGRTIDRIVLQK